MDFLIGIKGADFVIMAADCSQARSIVVMKHDMDKSAKISNNTLMLTSGPVGDCTHFAEYIQKNVKLNELRNGVEATVWSNANYIRTQLATALRSRGAYQVNLVVGGYSKDDDEKPGPQLYYIDHLAAFAEVPFAAQGYGGFFTLSILDKHYKEGMNQEEAIVLLKRCMTEVRHRFMVQMPKFKVFIVDKDGQTDISEDERMA